MTKIGTQIVHAFEESQPYRGPIHTSAERGVQWLVGLQQEDGSLQGGTHIGAYYKVGFALATCGRIRECDRLLDYVMRQYLKSDGDLNGHGLKWFETYRIYPHSWLLIAAVMRGRFDLALPLLRFITSYFHRPTGGFFATADGRREGKGTQEMMTTSLAGLACLWAGNVDIALAVGRWLQQVYDAQPDLSKGLYHVWHSENGLVVNFPKAEAVSFLVDATATQQWYFQYGISAAFLSSLFGATQDHTWLRLAQQYLRASRYCREDVYRFPTSGKIGWGSAWTYRYTRDLDDKHRAETVAKGLIALQKDNGSWISDSDEADAGGSIDETAEFVGFQGAISLVVE